MIAGLDHIGFTVSNLGRALQFYRDLLGLELLWERVYEEEYVRALVGYPTATLKCAYLKLPASNTALELVEYQNALSMRVDMHTANPGNAHLCLAVKDLDAVFARLRGAGVEFVSTPATSTAGYYKSSKTVYLHDPDGISLQLVEPHIQGQ